MTTQALIIDDNARNARILQTLLRAQAIDGVIITDARTLGDRLAVVGGVQIIFLDLEMPHVDGFDVLEQLRADEACAGIPVIAYSVHANELSRAVEAGFDGFIGKPLDSDRFGDQLQRILAGQAVWETGR